MSGKPTNRALGLFLRGTSPGIGGKLLFRLLINAVTGQVELPPQIPGQMPGYPTCQALTDQRWFWTRETLLHIEEGVTINAVAAPDRRPGASGGMHRKKHGRPSGPSQNPCPG